MKATQTFFQGFIITTIEKNGLYRATALSNRASIYAVYGLSNQDAIQTCKLHILKYLASTRHKPSIIAQDNYVLHLNRAAQLMLKTQQTAGLRVDSVFTELLSIKPHLKIVGLIECPPMRMISLK
ncbi:hypothetical protein PCC7424_3984 [Gloeothece citriformis PCC 7424]|uniref:Uncharacterized protein n=1 Tax=Gloeothece citriformis (strain PCC 7424) TaxID=65393 RepID=B7KKY6_GLOC7|nr:hypothetical protein [Gloeothece citriformis]ACK72358.1 hypothetical protein PCC7424_3984 [Gloeothece citriformis PCC 7424]